MTTSTAFKPMSKNDVADVLGVSLRTIENWVNDGSLPAPSKLGNRCYWHPTVFYAWLERRLVGDAEPTSARTGAEVLTVPSESGTADVAAARVQPAPQKKPASERAASVDRMRAKNQADLKALMA